MKIYASVIICTRNRRTYIKNCLQSLLEQDYPGNNFEVVLVDNASTDGTEDEVMEFASLLNLQYVREPVIGLSRARNRGLETARGKIGVFLDDDTITYPNWLTELLKPFETFGMEVGIVAGDVDPIWESARPDWLADRYLKLYSAGLNWDTEPRFMNNKEWFFEGNTAIRIDILKGKGGFNESLGRAGDSLVSGEGIIFDQLKQEGVKAYYNPYARVQHIIHAGRLNKTWLLKRCFAQGVSTAIFSEYFPKTVGIPNAGINIKWLLETELENLQGDKLYALTVLLDRLGYILKKKNLL